MNKKTTKRISGGIAIYYGITCIVGAIGGVAGMGKWLLKVFADQVIFSWTTLIALCVLIGVLALLGYSILRVGYENIEK